MFGLSSFSKDDNTADFKQLVGRREPTNTYDERYEDGKFIETTIENGDEDIYGPFT